MAEPGWHADPTGRYEQRWWDGERWTDGVSTAGAAFSDPYGGQPPEPDRTMLDRPQLTVHLGPGGLTHDGTWTIGEQDGSGVLGYVQVQRGRANTSLALYVVQDAAGRTLLDVRRPAGLRPEVVIADHQGLLVSRCTVHGSGIEVKGPVVGLPGALGTMATGRVHGMRWGVRGPGLPQLKLDVAGAPVAAIDAVADEQDIARWLVLDRDPAMPDPLRTAVVGLLAAVSVVKAETDLAQAKSARGSMFS